MVAGKPVEYCVRVLRLAVARRRGPYRTVHPAQLRQPLNQLRHATINMTYYLIKLFVSAGIIVVVSETAKRSSLIAALVASLPITSLLAFVWIYAETGDRTKLADMSRGIFWLVLPSLPLFWIFPRMLESDKSFSASLGIATAITVICYLGMMFGLKKLGILI